MTYALETDNLTKYYGKVRGIEVYFPKTPSIPNMTDY